MADTRSMGRVTRSMSGVQKPKANSKKQTQKARVARQKRRPKPKPPVTICEVCCTDLTEDNHSDEPLCVLNHEQSICSQCITHVIGHQIEHWPSVNIQCLRCGSAMHFEMVRKYASGRDFSKWDTSLVHHSIQEASEVLVHCPVATCDGAQIHVSGDEHCDNPNSTTCWKCDTQYCVAHTSELHKNLTCGEFDIVLDGPGKAQDLDRFQSLVKKMDAATADYVKKTAENRAQLKLSQKLIDEEFAKCPNPTCAIPCEKGEGCHLVTCANCKTLFCWECRTVQTATRPGRRHESNCPWSY